MSTHQPPPSVTSQSPFKAALDQIEAAGYGYDSEWIGPVDDRLGAVFTLRTRSGRIVKRFSGASPTEAAAKALAYIG